MIAYVVACWFGVRRVRDKVYEADRADYINWQVKQLFKLETSHIGKIIFVFNDMDFTEVNIPSSIRGIPVEILRRENIGLSYGAWDHAYQTYGEEFDGYFIVEDDYIPVIDNFDSIYMDKIDDVHRYVCSLYRSNHAAISNGLIMTNVLKKMSGIPHPRTANYQDAEQEGQVAISRRVETREFGVAHIADQYCVPFLDANGSVLYYGVGDGEKVLSPVYLERGIL